MAELKIYLAVMGAAGVITALVLLYRRIEVLLFGVLVEGTVVGHATRDSDDAVFYHPTVSFIDSKGKEQRFSSVAGSGGRRPAIGRKVPVRYLEGDPPRAYISSFLHMWAAPLALALLGAAGTAAFLRN